MTRFRPSYDIPPSMLDAEPRLGEGVSRPKPDAKTRLFKLLVSIPGSNAMKVTMRAETAAKAKHYARNCWPNASILVIK